jgi:hypothetical protein
MNRRNWVPSSRSLKSRGKSSIRLVRLTTDNVSKESDSLVVSTKDEEISTSCSIDPLEFDVTDSDEEGFVRVGVVMFDAAGVGSTGSPLDSAVAFLSILSV